MRKIVQRPTKKEILRARELRLTMTKPERILWKLLRILPPELNLTFRRQHPIHPFIVDFVCLRIKLVIELDGESHETRYIQDQTRDHYLAKCGYWTLRFTNDDLMKDSNSVMETILREALQRLQTKSPLPA